MKNVIAFVGMPGSGKSTAMNIANKYGTIFTMGDIVREECSLRKIKITPENLGNIAEELRQVEGLDVIAKRTINKIQNCEAKVIFIDGLRSMHEVALFKQNFTLYIVAVDVDDETRHNWLIQRKRADDSVSLDDIRKRDQREIEFGVKEVIKNANLLIINSGSISELESACETAITGVINID